MRAENTQPPVRRIWRLTCTLLLFAVVCSRADVNAAKSPYAATMGTAVLWHVPGRIAKSDLYYGSGGRAGQPEGPYVFVKEDLEGTNPKFDVRDGKGRIWKVKLGNEAQPETVATRLLWAVGYFTTEDYFLPQMRIEKMPTRLHRGQRLVGPEGVVYKARLKRSPGEEKIGSWRWDHNPFEDSRQFNGLRVMMALINNWDVKTINNAIYQTRSGKAGTAPEQIYLVSDLGASFGTTGRVRPPARAKGSLNSYRTSKMISKITPDYVDFNVPTREALIYATNPVEFVWRLQLRRVCKRVPRSDVRWIAQLLGELSRDQIRAAFRAAGYSEPDVEGFTTALLQRIMELKQL